ncbi:MAG: hypothetical protein K8J31_28990 [Anaerolineae bacterium]|nr:hypothetical protein [Anaerolineae bacterium]
MITNESDDEVYFFLPRGRADGVQFRVQQAGGFEIKAMTEEPEPGLVGEQKLSPGSQFSQRYLLTEWLRFKEPGDYTVECAIELELYNASLRQKDVERTAAHVAISTPLHFTILPPP